MILKDFVLIYYCNLSLCELCDVSLAIIKATYLLEFTSAVPPLDIIKLANYMLFNN